MTNLSHDQEHSLEYRSSAPPSQACPRAKDPGVAIIRREFVELTGDHFSAVVLNQLLYWTQRVKDFDLLLEEERNFNPDCNVLPRHGWIYKTAPELIEETMLKASPPTMRKYLKLLIDQGWVDERIHPIDRWNKTTQYRVNLRKLQEALQVIGHTFPAVYREIFTFREDCIHPTGNFNTIAHKERFTSTKDNDGSSLNLPISSEEAPNLKIEQSCKNSSDEIFLSKERSFPSNKRNFSSEEKNLPSNEKKFGSYTYAETTQENTNKEHTQRTRARRFFDEILEIKSLEIKSLEIWKTYVGQDVTLTDDRKRQVKLVLAHHFQNDLSQWERFCERIKLSPFLMGEGSRRWRVTFDWILSAGNVLKVLEGNFDKPEGAQFRETLQNSKLSSLSGNQRADEKTAILASIEDPQWKEWCAQLICGNQYESPISLSMLQKLTQAKVTEFDGRLVWIDCKDQETLNCIENLRLKLLSIAQQTFPQMRNIRTRLWEPSSLSNQVSSSTTSNNPIVPQPKEPQS